MQRQNKISSVLIVFVTLLALTIGSVASPVPVYAVSTITVNTSADHTPTDGFCSLREAIHNANYDAAIYRDCAAGSGNDFIVFDPSVFPDFASSPKIVLLKTLQIRDTDGLTIDGGAAYVTISGNSQVRVFTVNSGASLTLKNLRVYEGSEDSGGGAVLNYGRLTIDHSSFVGNRAGAGPGGAIYSIGSLVIVYGIFLSNSSSSPSPSQGGGAIYHDYDSDLLVARSSFAGNRAAYGAAININRGTGHRITESAFMDNDGVSGAILNRGFTEISNSTFTGNDATDIGGAIYNLQNMIVINNTFSGNSAVVPRGAATSTSLAVGHS